AWFTQGEGAPDEAIYGRFKLFEITGGDGAWTDRFVSEGVENSNPVTWSSLNGSFVELSGVAEDDTPPPDNASGNPFGPLYPGLLASNGGFDGANRVASIPVETINRLISGQSIGLAMGSVSPAPTPLSGDYNGDSQVDGRDMCLWQRELGNTVDPGTGADGNGNGQVDAADLDVWADHFGAASNASAGTTNFSIHTTESFFSPLSAPTLNFDWAAPMASTHVVPEPGVGSILVVVAALPVARRGRSAS
ncbi:MAG TPA: dockerin type I domain-containing protein, partial [Lacipirellula sp.]